MKAITIVTNSGEEKTFAIPKGCNGHLCLRALHQMNSGTTPANLTERESEFVADIVAMLTPVEEVEDERA